MVYDRRRMSVTGNLRGIWTKVHYITITDCTDANRHVAQAIDLYKKA